MSRYEQDEGHRYFGIEGSWENSANHDVVIGLNTVQFGQLFVQETELYAEIDPARGWRARLSLGSADALGDAPVGETGSTVQLVQDPFGIPPTMTAMQTDVLLKASDGESLTPLEQQLLVQLDEPIELPNAEVSQAIALVTLHAVRLGVSPGYVNLMPFVMVEVPYAMAARGTISLRPGTPSRCQSDQGRQVVRGRASAHTARPVHVYGIGRRCRRAEPSHGAAQGRATCGRCLGRIATAWAHRHR